MRERTRRAIFVALLAVAVAGAFGLMTSGLVEDPQWRTPLQVLGTVAALGCGLACAVLAWRWWSGQWRHDGRPGS